MTVKYRFRHAIGSAELRSGRDYTIADNLLGEIDDALSASDHVCCRTESVGDSGVALSRSGLSVSIARGLARAESRSTARAASRATSGLPQVAIA